MPRRALCGKSSKRWSTAVRHGCLCPGKQQAQVSRRPYSHTPKQLSYSALPVPDSGCVCRLSLVMLETTDCGLSPSMAGVTPACYHTTFGVIFSFSA